MKSGGTRGSKQTNWVVSGQPVSASNFESIRKHHKPHERVLQGQHERPVVKLCDPVSLLKCCIREL